MTDKPDAIHEEELHAYVDGRLAPARAVVVEAYLAANPEVQARAQAYRAQNRALQALFGPVLDEPVPARLEETLAQRQRLPWRVAAALAWIAVGGMTGFLLHGFLNPPVALIATGFAERAAIAHVVYVPEVLHPVEVTAAQESHLVQWLSKRMGKELHTPDLTAFGYRLVGGRLLPGDKGPAAQFMYQDAAGARLTLYVAASGDAQQPSAFRFLEENGVNVFYWVDGKLGFALVADTDRARLLDIAHAAYQAISF